MKTAVILLNLGGPDSIKSVRPFLYNLFSDPAILHLPGMLRKVLAWVISWRRTAKARAIYQKIGGKSPLLELTQAQAQALEERLKSHGEFKAFVCMRYWHPMSGIVAKNVAAWRPDRIVLLPLYPQFSTATTASSLADWKRSAAAAGISVPTAEICCYPAERSFAAAHARLIREAYWKAAEYGKPRILFSAHGLPEKIVHGGDPYPWQVNETVAAVMKVLAIDAADYAVCYQSRVGPLAWIGPATEEEIARAGAGKIPLVVVPVSFVSDHSETLVELDIDYRKLAEESGVPGYFRVPALNTDPLFIEALADLVTGVGKEDGVISFTKQRNCPRQFGKCACQTEAEDVG